LAALDALRATAWRDGRLLATRRDDRAELNAYLDDHAFLLAALLEAMQTRFRAADFEWARAVADALLARFEDAQAGGFHFTSHDHEKLFYRTKPGHDNATPSGNGTAAQALLQFGHLTGDVRHVDAARRTVALFAGAMAESPGGYSTLLGALTQLDSPPTLVLLQGESGACAQWQRALEARYRPDVLVFNLGGAQDVPASLRKGPPPPTGAIAFVCRNMTCLPAIATLDAVVDALASTGGASAR
jgi:uncharacterized protein YyaL (SSP411 family)